MIRKQLLRSALVLALAGAWLASSANARAAADEQVVKTGQFVGVNRHVAGGTVQLIKTETGYRVVLAKDFRFDGAPDPKLGFGDEAYVSGTLFSALRTNSGAQSYPLPRGSTPERFNSLVLWCETYAVPLAVAVWK